MEPIRHCDDLWIDAMVCVGFNLAHGSRQKMQSIFRTLRPLTIIFYLVFFLLVITIPNHSGVQPRQNANMVSAIIALRKVDILRVDYRWIPLSPNHGTALLLKSYPSLRRLGPSLPRAICCSLWSCWKVFPSSLRDVGGRSCWEKLEGIPRADNIVVLNVDDHWGYGWRKMRSQLDNLPRRETTLPVIQ